MRKKNNSTGKPDRTKTAKSQRLQGERLSEAETRILLESLQEKPKRKTPEKK